MLMPGSVPKFPTNLWKSKLFQWNPLAESGVKRGHSSASIFRLCEFTIPVQLYLLLFCLLILSISLAQIEGLSDIFSIRTMVRRGTMSMCRSIFFARKGQIVHTNCNLFDVRRMALGCRVLEAKDLDGGER